ncbi:MAG: B12-binding domain-containing radical SAM protein [Firmicutes bacterium]|nr:B12-binding domain-containing radical SAM protein [Bacillota bacterium]
MTKKKIILIYTDYRKMGTAPYTPDIYTVPLGLLSLSYFLEKEGYKPEILDTTIDNYKNMNLDNVLCVGFSVMTGAQILNSIEIAQFIRNINPKIPLVWGGIHPTLLPEETAKNPLVDVAVKGEGEHTLVELVKCFESGKPIDKIQGIAYKNGSTIVSKPFSPMLDMNSIGILPYHLLNIEKYGTSHSFRLNTSRGCPGRCKFCSNMASNNKIWRGQDAAKVIEQLSYIVKKFNPGQIIFEEDNFFADPIRVEKICKSIIETGLKIKWMGFCRSEHFLTFSRELMNLIKNAGCNYISFGGESGSQKILNKISKGTKPGHMIKATKLCGELGIKPLFSFMSGFPWETSEDLEATLNVIDEIIKANPAAEISGIFIYTPYPGTPIYDLAIEQGFTPPASMEEWGTFQFGNTTNVPWVPPGKLSKLKTLLSISRFPFYTKKIILPPVFQSKHNRLIAYMFRAFYRFLCFSARSRWRRRFFRFPIEWNIYNWYQKKIRSLSGVV